MQGQIRINARDLGKVALADFCPRCFWLTSRFPLSTEHPFRSPMPGVSSTLDAYIKDAVNHTLTQTGKLPNWLVQVLGELQVVSAIKPQRWETKIGNFVLVGEPDVIWQLADGTIFIADYKVAQWTQRQEEIFPLYETQLKAYAYLAEKIGHRVSGLALVYLQPQRYSNNPSKVVSITAEQLTLHFDCLVKPITSWSPQEVEDMVVQVGSILSSDKPPHGRNNCKKCLTLKEWLNGLMQVV